MSDQNKTDDGFFQIVVSISRPEQFLNKLVQQANAVEIRLDLMPNLPIEAVENFSSKFDGSLILTVRSAIEGGAFSGSPSQWKDMITPFLQFVSMVDVEKRYCEYASWIQDLGISVIASCHLFEMPDSNSMRNILSDLRAFGDVPKIVVQPRDNTDILSLLQFTHTSPKPLIVSITGKTTRYVRPILPLFGSLFTYCYVDNPTSPGQYSLEEMNVLAKLLSPGFVDTWFDSPIMNGGIKPYKEREKG